ncbi:M28 family peptidase [Pacificimonas sp. WHA3]|uniref:M28 family peptidase n=1 Tax=Pacificimonas pallii TaxID=2827236 RepID=A0ABS6SEL1_9SPHN|nr:M28 family peptidase [Pacificimonas pallii]MBV7256710.1 M28 family peptidase [Pacificimonas pallii]
MSTGAAWRAPLFLLILAGCVGDTIAPAPYIIDRGVLAAHVAFLADDALEGRLAGSPGDRVATDYIAGAFEQAGAVALPGGISEQMVATGKERVSRNVMAMVPGTDVPGEYVLYIAHHDGQGRGGTLCLDAAPIDDICNSAVDNASGVAVLIELARLFARHPAKRSLIFLASAAEEQGLRGARAFIADPPVPLANIRAVIGMDTLAGRGYRHHVALLGEGLTTLDPLAAQAAAADGRRLVRSRESRDFYDRSDHFPFAEAGIPAVMLSGLFDPADGGINATQYMRHRYHRAGDEAGAVIDWSGAQADAGLVHRFGRMIADAAQAPEWRPHSPYQRP